MYKKLDPFVKYTYNFSFFFILFMFIFIDHVFIL